MYYIQNRLRSTIEPICNLQSYSNLKLLLCPDPVLYLCPPGVNVTLEWSNDGHVPAGPKLASKILQPADIGFPQEMERN